jgi:hypothetical protein
MFVQEVEQDEEAKREAAIRKGLAGSPKKKVGKMEPKVEVRATEMEDEPVDYNRGFAQRGALPKPAFLPDSWEDKCEE